MSKPQAKEQVEVLFEQNGGASSKIPGHDQDPDPSTDEHHLLTSRSTREIHDNPKPTEEWANPCVVGLLGFALTTMCIGLSTAENLGIDGNPGLSMALVFGGGAQFIAGLIALRKGWIFPGTVFVAYGSFWMSVFMMLVVMPVAFGIPPEQNDLLIYWFMWTLVTITFLISSWKHGPGIFVTFVILIIAFLMLDVKELMAIHNINNAMFNRATGWITFLCGLAAWATATAIMTNNQYGKTVIPLEKFG